MQKKFNNLQFGDLIINALIIIFSLTIIGLFLLLPDSWLEVKMVYLAF